MDIQAKLRRIEETKASLAGLSPINETRVVELKKQLEAETLAREIAEQEYAAAKKDLYDTAVANLLQIIASCSGKTYPDEYSSNTVSVNRNIDEQIKQIDYITEDILFHSIDRFRLPTIFTRLIKLVEYYDTMIELVDKLPAGRLSERSADKIINDICYQKDYFYFLQELIKCGRLAKDTVYYKLLPRVSITKEILDYLTTGDGAVYMPNTHKIKVEIPVYYND